MRKILLLIGMALTISVEAQDFQWAKKLGGTSNEFSSSIATDASKNVYTIGWFNGTVDFNPGTGTSDLTSAGSDDIYVSKLDASGNFVWAKRIGGTSSDIGYGIALDATGNVFITGSFVGTVDFDPGANTTNLVSAGLDDVFVCKLDASGNFVWAKRMGGNSNDLSYSIAIDASGNIYTTGHFRGTSDFDPGANTANLVSNGQDDIFISKLDASGNYVWAKNIGGTSYDYGNSISLDVNGSVYSTGEFSETVDFNPGTATDNLTSNGGIDVYILKLDPSGNFSWAKSFGSLSDDSGNSIVVDDNDNVYSTGTFLHTVDFDPGVNENELTSEGGLDIYIVRFDGNGNLTWAINMGGSADDESYSIALDVTGNIYTTGYFQGTATFDVIGETAELISAGGSDVFITKSDAASNLTWAKKIGGTGSDIGNAIAVDNSDNVCLTGVFTGTADFDFSIAKSELTSSGGYDIFVSKYSQTVTSIDNAITESLVNLYPNPTTDRIILESTDAILGKEYCLTDVTCKEIIKGKVEQTTTEINIENLPSGIYFLSFNGATSKKFFKIIKR